MQNTVTIPSIEYADLCRRDAYWLALSLQRPLTYLERREWGYVRAQLARAVAKRMPEGI